MMISPEGYYEEYLKGKTAAQIMTVIRGLKNEIGHLKNKMEHPDYASDILQSESTRLWCSRLYLERAKEALVEAGGTYTPSQAELKAAAFDESVPAITKLVFSIDGFFGGHETRTVTVDSAGVSMTVGSHFSPEDGIVVPEKIWSVTKEDFIDGIRDLHIGEWRRYYSTRRFGYFVCDGTQWELNIEFSDGHMPFTVSGDNAYPYNFDAFRIFLGMDPMKMKMKMTRRTKKINKERKLKWL